MAKIENVKNYVGQELAEIFFRPMLTGPDANALGINIMYNAPVPTTMHLWRGAQDILKPFTTGGWSADSSSSPERFSKTIELTRVKAEMGYGADEYYSMIYGKIANTPGAQMGDLTGTELERAETELFRQSVAESLRATMWVGCGLKTDAEGHIQRFHSFNGFLNRIASDDYGDAGGPQAPTLYDLAFADLSPLTIDDFFKRQLDEAKPQLRDLKSSGNLAFFVSSKVYDAYEEFVMSGDFDGAWMARQNGQPQLYYRGIPVIDVQIDGYLDECEWLPKAFSLLSDRRNLVLAVNTADFPGTEVKMWYNPDAMENRQRAVFMAAADYLMPELVSLMRFK